jgi:hypothetical protein
MTPKFFLKPINPLLKPIPPILKMFGQPCLNIILVFLAGQAVPEREIVEFVFLAENQKGLEKQFFVLGLLVVVVQDALLLEEVLEVQAELDPEILPIVLRCQFL